MVHVPIIYLFRISELDLIILIRRLKDYSGVKQNIGGEVRIQTKKFHRKHQNDVPTELVVTFKHKTTPLFLVLVI